MFEYSWLDELLDQETGAIQLGPFDPVCKDSDLSHDWFWILQEFHWPHICWNLHFELFRTLNYFNLPFLKKCTIQMVYPRQKGFQELHESFSTQPIFQHPNPAEPFAMETNDITINVISTRREYM